MNFHLGAILTAATGKFVAREFAEFHQLAEHLTGGPVWTHQLIRLAGPIRDEVVRQLPWLAAITAPEFDLDGLPPEQQKELVWAWVDKQVAQYGAEHSLRPMAVADQDRREPIAELVEMVGPDRVVPVAVRQDGAS